MGFKKVFRIEHGAMRFVSLVWLVAIMLHFEISIAYRTRVAFNKPLEQHLLYSHVFNFLRLSVNE